MKTEIELLRDIADATKEAWDKGRLSINDVHLKNLLTDRIDLITRVSQPGDASDLVKTVRKAQVEAGEQTVIDNLKRLGF